MIESVVEALRNPAVSAFYHQYSDGRIAHGFVTDLKHTVTVDAEEVERLTHLTHMYVVHRIEGTPVVHVRRKV